MLTGALRLFEYCDCNGNTVLMLCALLMTLKSKTKTMFISSGPCQDPEDIFTIDENTKQVKCLPKHHRKIKRIFDVLPSNKNGGAANCGSPGGKCSGLRAPGFLCKRCDSKVALKTVSLQKINVTNRISLSKEMLYGYFWAL